MPALPPRPSLEHLRKEAKRTARERRISLAEAQRALALEYGVNAWPDLLRAAQTRRDTSLAQEASPIAAAARLGNVSTVRRLLSRGIPADDRGADGNTPLWHVADSGADTKARVAIIEVLIAGGGNPRLFSDGETPLHAAARRGPAAVIEALLRGNALEWQPDTAGRTPLDIARRNRPRERAQIIAILDRSIVSDASFRAAIDAIHRGDAAELDRLIAAEPRLLRERILGPEVYREAHRTQYFRDPKLFWFIANNPNLAPQISPRIVEVTQVMLRHGVAQDDLDYALGLVVSSSSAREGGQQAALIRTLLEAGARVSEQAVLWAGGHRETEALRALLAAGLPMTAPIAAALGEAERVEALLAAHPDEAHAALSLAIVNGHAAAARAAIAAGADVNAPAVVHAHATPLHQAAGDGRVDLVELLLAAGADPTVRDTLWDGTPLGWARYGDRKETAAILERVTPG